jgi:hypothetical protein
MVAGLEQLGTVGSDPLKLADSLMFLAYTFDRSKHIPQQDGVDLVDL